MAASPCRPMNQVTAKMPKPVAPMPMVTGTAWRRKSRKTGGSGAIIRQPNCRPKGLTLARCQR